MHPSSATAHWESVYSTKDPREVSWFEESPEASLQLIADAGLPPGAAIIDVGAGASALGPALAAQGYEVTVADISATALEAAAAAGIEAVLADARDHDFGRTFDLWHDRAVFHFMVSATDQDAYLATLRGTLRPQGQLVIATFGPEGPESCSGLPVHRYGHEELAARLGGDFSLVSWETLDHRTPGGNVQQFLFARFLRR